MSDVINYSSLWVLKARVMLPEFNLRPKELKAKVMPPEFNQAQKHYIALAYKLQRSNRQY